MLCLAAVRRFSMVISVALWKNRAWKTATGSENSCGWSRQCFMSSYTELVHREPDILKQELRRTCAVDRPHYIAAGWSRSRGHGIVPYAAHSPGTQIRYRNVTHTPRTPQA